MVARFRHRRQVSGKLVSEAVTDFLEVKERESSPEYYDHLRHALEDQLAVAAADMLLGDVTADHLRRLFDSLDYHPVTMRNKIAYLKAFFRWCVRERYLVEDPTAHLKAPKIINEEVGILTPGQGRALMKAAAKIDRPFAARVALQAFAGLRAANAIRLEVEEIDFKARTILIPAAKFKTGKRHLIEAGELRNLWTWLDPVQGEDWSITAKQYRYRLGKAYEAAGINPPKNALRHSFATYKCAVDGEAGKASYILGHGNPREIWQSYKGVASAEAGREWFRICG
jgi:integrase